MSLTLRGKLSRKLSVESGTSKAGKECCSGLFDNSETARKWGVRGTQKPHTKASRGSSSSSIPVPKISISNASLSCYNS